MTPQGTLTILTLIWWYALWIYPVPALIGLGLFLIAVICVVLKNKSQTSMRAEHETNF